MSPYLRVTLAEPTKRPFVAPSEWQRAHESDAAEMASTPNFSFTLVRSVKSFVKLASGLSTVTPRESWNAWNDTSSWFCAQL